MSHELPNRAALREGRVSLDVVVAVWNEEEMLPLLFERLTAVFTPESLARSGIASVRYVMVDDGSRDRSAAVIAEAIAAGAPAVLYRLSRNFGHQGAISAGLHFADADVVAIIDADLQDPPELIPQMIERWRGGHDVIYAQRRKRREGPLKRLGYWAFYRAVAFMADIEIPLDTGDFCLMDRRVLDTLRALPEKLRFPRILRAWVGFRQEGIEYDRPPRQAGRTKYSLGRLYRLATDGIASASVRPLQAAQVFSVSYLLLILVLGIVVLLRPGAIEAPPAVVAGFLLILVGNLVQVFCIYILGAYVGRTYLEVKGRPAFVVMEVVGGTEKR
jgi:dolichol-phosphate mannosyltransferase